MDLKSGNILKITKYALKDGNQSNQSQHPTHKYYEKGRKFCSGACLKLKRSNARHFLKTCLFPAYLIGLKAGEQSENRTSSRIQVGIRLPHQEGTQAYHPFKNLLDNSVSKNSFFEKKHKWEPNCTLVPFKSSETLC